jgi:small subunit ribosomal protein S8
MLTDPVADMLARLKNANKALHETVEMPASNLKSEIARLLRDEGYIKDYRIEKGESFDTLVIELKFGPKRERIITDVKRVSKPGRRVYATKDRLPRVLERPGHEPHGAGARRRRRSSLLRLVAP